MGGASRMNKSSRWTRCQPILTRGQSGSSVAAVQQDDERIFTSRQQSYHTGTCATIWKEQCERVFEIYRSEGSMHVWAIHAVILPF